MKAKIGLIINPIAGLGGKAGYKGSDCKEHLEHALQNGYQKCSAIRARECLRHILDIKQDIIVLAGKGHEDYQEICGVKHHMDERELIADIIKENPDLNL